MGGVLSAEAPSPPGLSTKRTAPVSVVRLSGANVRWVADRFSFLPGADPSEAGGEDAWSAQQWCAGEPPEPPRRGSHAVWGDLGGQRGVRGRAPADRRAGGDGARVRRVAT